jgi:hypothetical protein
VIRSGPPDGRRQGLATLTTAGNKTKTSRKLRPRRLPIKSKVEQELKDNLGKGTAVPRGATRGNR